MEKIEDTVSTAAPGGLKPTLSTGRIIYMVVACAAPMASVMGAVPVAFGLGNGAGVPLTFVGVATVLALFAVGYTRMSRRVVSTGAFYAYVIRGLGRIPGLGAAFLAIVSYAAYVAGAIAYFSFFARTALSDLAHIDIPWGWYALIGLAAIGVLGYRQIEFSSRLLMLLITIEVGVLMVLNIAFIVHKGASAFPLHSLSLSAVTSGAPGIAVMFGFTCFIGFESAALYSEEARDPKRSVSRATYGSLVVIAVFYLLTSWVTVGAVGASKIQSTALSDLGGLYFGLSDQYLARWVTDLMEIFLATSLFATALALHNITARYVFALGRHKCLPTVLGRTHSRHGSPHAASIAVSVLATAVVGTCLILHVPPYIGLGAVAVGFGTVGIIALQGLTSLAVVGYFRRQRSTDVWRTIVAPLLGFAGLATAVALSLTKFSLLSGTDDRWINLIPCLLLAAFIAGISYAAWLRIKRPVVYHELGEELVEAAKATG
ncbi:APC family permease [Streptomyces acidicola]|uniref:APC family permease n=1 Tax=Streptomyces acidicola TaxID=2596892 RepID=UPI0037FCE5A0